MNPYESPNSTEQLIEVPAHDNHVTRVLGYLALFFWGTLLASGLAEVIRYQSTSEAATTPWYEVSGGGPLMIVSLVMGASEYMLLESGRNLRKWLALGYVCLILGHLYFGRWYWFEILAGFYPFDEVDDCIPYRGNAPFAVIMTIILYMIGLCHLYLMVKGDRQWRIKNPPV